MKRRQVLAAIGAASGGSALLTSTGAFTSVSADRDVAVQVAGDADAYLRFAPCTDNGNEQPNGEYVVTSGGQLGVDLTDSNSPPSGDGVNPDARSTFDNVFEICNQGTQDVCVDFAIDVPEIPGPVPDSYDFEAGDPAVVFYRGDNRDEFVTTSELDVDRDGAITVETGECQCIGFAVRSFGFSSADTIFDGAELTIRAEAGADCEDGTVDPVPTPPQNGLLSHWPLDSIDDGTAEDVVGTNDGTPNGGGISDATGQVDQAADFDGDSWIDVPGFPNLQSSFTISAWIRTRNRDEEGQRVFVDDDNNTGGYALSLGDGGSGKMRFYSRGLDSNGLTSVILDTDDPVIDNDTWHHAVAVVDTSAQRRWIYVDGNEEASDTYTNSWETDGGTAAIGGETAAGDTEQRFDGRIDDVRIYDRALSAQEVQDLYDATK